MPYDKYRNWGPDLPNHDGIKKEVLIDLEKSTDDIDRLEILDSFEAYVERQKQDELAEDFAMLIARKVVLPLLADFLKAQLPKPMPISRGRPGAVLER